MNKILKNFYSNTRKQASKKSNFLISNFTFAGGRDGKKR